MHSRNTTAIKCYREEREFMLKAERMRLRFSFVPILAGATLRDRLLACVGGVLGIALTSLVCITVLHASAPLPRLVAPVGASAVLVFAVPASPLAQPWSVVGGNVVSALVGVTVARFVPVPHLAVGLAVGGAILAMSLLRCSAACIRRAALLRLPQ